MGIIEFIKTFILPVIDILLVTYLLYKTYSIITETRAYLALKGLLLIIVVYLVSSLLPLNTLNLIMKIVISYGVIAFIVVFQPEIRRVLMRMGENKFWGFVADSAFQTLNEIIKAVKFMSKKKIGALIVLKKESGLINIINTGVKLDAMLTSDLIVSIFFKNNPLHDGAIIVEGDRVIAASCFLPLSDAVSRKRFGTRHRAALGLSYDSDAVIIVVSEETGIISVAANGVLKSNYDETSLKNELNRLLSE
ncbi:MAG: diadenylate cyclase CdaA [Spirochaetes bacterium]|nr:diadenylate cyclase CdaA [Spirochaetota bacterium]